MGIPTDLDKSSMKELIAFFPKMIGLSDLPQVVESEAKNLSKASPKGIIMVGMGGSSIAGQYCSELLLNESRIPLLIIRDYDLPGYVDKNWIVVAVSYSGNTEETISCFNAAKQRNCESFIISSGGELTQLGERNRVTPLPKGLQPRATLPLIFSAEFQLIRMLSGLEKFNFDATRVSVEAARSLWGNHISHPSVLSERIQHKIPVFMGAHHLDAAAYRAKCQINENAKSAAFYASIPEANHNEVEAVGTYSKHDITVVLMRSSFESASMSRRFDVTKEIYEEEEVDVNEIRMKFDDKVAETLSFTHFFDELSFQLALLNGVDSVEVPKISRLKKKL
ncbi:bifunctional phosphoglucose/phosphomannose isomerase [Candidatus Thorarchaeota archaeon]|nr:MAG: bifunctional phosphoglucose/phosphomannose isomerase [Candidatus Thorarchaeota archaeon]